MISNASCKFSPNATNSTQSQKSYQWQTLQGASETAVIPTAEISVCLFI